MRKAIYIAVLLFFYGGCGSNDKNPHQKDLGAWREKAMQIKNEGYYLAQEREDLEHQRSVLSRKIFEFIQTLDDNKLSIYHSLREANKNEDIVEYELVWRRLKSIYNSDEFATAVQIESEDLELKEKELELDNKDNEYLHKVYQLRANLQKIEAEEGD